MPLNNSASPASKLLRQVGLCAGLAMTANVALASPEISGGVWFNYTYQFDGDKDTVDSERNSLGTFGDEAFALFVDSSDDKSPWVYSAELRIGPGSFTDSANNSTGSDIVLYKAWVGYQFADDSLLTLGKSQVPFGKSNANFWPGVLLKRGYGNQQDIGISWSSNYQGLDYNLAYFHADDWGTSTDTPDDNGAWGSKDTYRKVHTVVADGSREFAEGQRLGISAQYGRLQDLTGLDASNPVDGRHAAGVIYYDAQFNNLYVNAQYIHTYRKLPSNHWQSADLNEEVKNDRYALSVGYQQGDWAYYVDAIWANPKTAGNDVGTRSSFAPGVSYNYGPGSIYAELQIQDGRIDRNGMVIEDDYSAFFVTVDYYF